MDVLVEIEDDVLLRLELMALEHNKSLNEELLDILRRAAKDEKIRKRKTKKQ